LEVGDELRHLVDVSRENAGEGSMTESSSWWVHVESTNVADPLCLFEARCNQRAELTTHSGDENLAGLHTLNLTSSDPAVEVNESRERAESIHVTNCRVDVRKCAR
jgi:hypothetical protein